MGSSVVAHLKEFLRHSSPISSAAREWLKPGRPPTAKNPKLMYCPPPRLTLTQVGATERTIKLVAAAPDFYKPLDASIQKLLALYLPQKKPDALDKTVVFAEIFPEIELNQETLERSNCDDFLENYKRQSIESGRSAEHTEGRIKRIRTYAENIKHGANFPPILLYYDGKDLVLLDGT